MKYLIWSILGIATIAIVLPFIKEEIVIAEANDDIDAPLDYEK